MVYFIYYSKNTLMIEWEVALYIEKGFSYSIMHCMDGGYLL